MNGYSEDLRGRIVSSVEGGISKAFVVDGARKVLRGDTTVNEVVRVTRLAAGEDL